MKVLDKDGLTYYTGKVKSTLTNYVQFTDYATSNKGGVVKTGYGATVSSQGELQAQNKSYSSYQSTSTNTFISKGTLENVITGKGLVSNTDYASNSVGGVFKTNSSYGTTIGSGTASGSLICLVKNYTDYSNSNDYLFVSKGTLENVLTARIGDIQTLLDNLNNGGGVQ